MYTLDVGRTIKNQKNNTMSDTVTAEFENEDWGQAIDPVTRNLLNQLENNESVY